MTDEDVLERCADRLLQCTGKAKWMTAKGLQRSLKIPHLEIERLEELLRSTKEAPEYKIRYSLYPSRKTLDTLWGHFDNVGERSLPNLTLDEGNEVWESRLQSGTNIFLSHSHKDATLTIEVADTLAKGGVGCWLAESELNPNAFINRAILEGMDSCPWIGGAANGELGQLDLG